MWWVHSAQGHIKVLGGVGGGARKEGAGRLLTPPPLAASRVDQIDEALLTSTTW